MPRKTTPTPAPSRPSDASLSIPEFCLAEGISKSTYFKMRELGLGPIETRFPGLTIVRIFQENRQRWHERMEQLAKDQAEKIAADFAARSASCKKKAKECQEGIRNGSIVKKKRQ